MSDELPPDQLGKLGASIDNAYGARAKARPGQRAQGGDSSQAISLGLRIGLELVVAVAVGTGVGYLLDRSFGTRPWGMVGCFFLGVAAGLVTVYKTITGIGMAAGYRQPGSGTPPAPSTDWDED